MRNPDTAGVAQALDPAALRALALSQPADSWTTLLGVMICMALLASVLYLVHRGKLREEYTPIWVVTSVAMLVVIGSFDILRMLTKAVGAWTPSSALFFFGLVFLVVLSLNYAVRLSGISLQIKLLAQEVALLREQAPGRNASPSSSESAESAPATEEVRTGPTGTPEREP